MHTDGDGAVPYKLPAAAPVGSRVLLARLAANLSAAEIAHALGVTLRTYQRCESGAGRPFRRGELFVIAALTGQELGFFEPNLVDGRLRDELVQ